MSKKQSSKSPAKPVDEKFDKSDAAPAAKVMSGLTPTPVNQFAVFMAMSRPYCAHGWIAIQEAVSGGAWFIDATQSDVHTNLYRVNGVN